MTCVMMCEPFSKAWLQWKSMHSTARKEKEKESKAARYFDLKVKRKTLCCWKSFMTRLQAKKKSQGHFILSLLFYSVLYCILAYNITFHNTFEYISSLVHILILFYFSYLFLALAQHFLHLQQMRMFWRKWCSALHLKRWQENCLPAARSLAAQDTQHRALGDWKHCILIIKPTLF